VEEPVKDIYADAKSHRSGPLIKLLLPVYDCTIMHVSILYRKDNIIIKDGLFHFISRSGMKL